MLSQLDRKLLRDLRRLKGQVLAVALVMACGLAMLIMARSLIVSLETTRDAYYLGNRFADVFASLKRAPAALAERIAELPGVAGVQTDIAVPVTLDLEDRDEPASGLMRSLPDFGPPELNRLFLRKGRWLAPETPGEVLVGEAFAVANKLEPGQSLPILIHGKLKRFRIAGIVLSPEYIFESRPGAALPDSRSYGIFWMPYKEISTAFDLYGAFNHVSLALAPGAAPAPVISSLDALLRPYGGLGAFGRKDHPSHVRVNDEINILRILSIGFPAIFLSVAAFMTNAVLTRLLALQREQIAILKAFGFSKHQIAAHYLKFSSLIVLIGTLAGTVLGVFLGMTMVKMYELFFRFPLLEFQLDRAALGIALTVGLVAIYAGVISSVRRTSRLPPAEAMRPEAPANYQPSVLERSGFGRFLSLPVRIALRNIERHPMQAFFTLAGLALGSALLIIPNTFKAGIAQVLDFQWDVVQRQDLTVVLTEPASPSVLHEFEHLPGVLSAEPGRFCPVRIHLQGRSRQLAIRSLVFDSHHNRTVDTRLREIPPQTEGLTVSSKLAEALGAKVGDTLVVESLEGRRLVTPLPLLALSDDLSGIAAYMELEALNRLLGEGDRVSSATLSIDPTHKSEFLHALKGLPRVGALVVKESMRKSFRDTTAQSMGLIQSIYLSFAVIVTFGVIYNNTRISLTERARELATLRVIGMTQREVGMVLVVELSLLTALALPLGLLLGTGFAAAIVRSVNTETVRLPLVFTSYTYSFAVFIVLLAAAFSTFVVLRKLRKLDLIGTLKAPE